MAVKGRTVVLGVTGSIAAYKTCDIVRQLKNKGAKVKVVMTEAAAHFITPLTLKTLSGEPVTTSLFAEESTRPLHHISIAEEADLILVAPATANFLAKVSTGIADDILSITVLAARSRIIIVPAMNERMYRNQATQRNIETLTERGFRLVGPVEGKLAEGEGIGRMAEIEDILDAVQDELNFSQDIKGKRVIVTAGGTREGIDAVRYIGNYSSGKMGFALAREAERRGARVTLISAPSSQLPASSGITFIKVTTTAEMKREVDKNFKDADMLIMAAAVADFKPAKPMKDKLKKSVGLKSIALEETPDILAGLKKNKNQIICGFAAETENLTENAIGKLKSKNLDLIVGNDVGDPQVGFGSEMAKAMIITKTGNKINCGIMKKEALARKIIDTARKFW